MKSFNTQPRGGGCLEATLISARPNRFQHTAARRRLLLFRIVYSRLSSFNTQPRGGGCPLLREALKLFKEFQHTAARRRLRLASALLLIVIRRFQHTAARRRLQFQVSSPRNSVRFQHTAARRRLPLKRLFIPSVLPVSTHSRAEAAAPYLKKQEKSAY